MMLNTHLSCLPRSPIAMLLALSSLGCGGDASLSEQSPADASTSPEVVEVDVNRDRSLPDSQSDADLSLEDATRLEPGPALDANQDPDEDGDANQDPDEDGDANQDPDADGDANQDPDEDGDANQDPDEDGDASQDPDEDDGGLSPGVPPTCGNLMIDGDEYCDAGKGNGMDGVGCRADCTLPVCGDGHRAPGEYCDDGNNAPGDGCDAACKTEHTLPSLEAPESATYDVIEPDATTIFGDAMVTLASSEHFVIRASYDDTALLEAHQSPGAQLSETTQAEILGRLEEVWAGLIDELGFAPPYVNAETRYKTNAFITDYGYLSGGTFSEPGWPEGPHPQLQMQYDATGGYHGMAHEFTHALQNMALSADWFDYGGWFSESHAEFMALRFLPDGPGCSEVLVNAPHHHYGTTRNRYCNWQFWDYLAEEFTMDAVNALWIATVNGPAFNGPFTGEIPEECGRLDGPFATLLRVMGWSVEQLNDAFGRWAMANVTWDYEQKGELFREAYGNYSDPLEAGKRGRLTRLDVSNEGGPYYTSPELLAPNRWGYNLVRLYPEPGAGAISVHFKGVVQTAPARVEPFGSFNMVPEEIPSPDSGWRWGVVAVSADGEPRYSALQAGARSAMRFDLQASDEEVYLMVMGAPMSLHQIFWDQLSYTVYRYPWRIKLSGALPDGAQPVSPPDGIDGENHSNGGGFVASSASVAATAFVGPEAMVLDNAMVSDDARVEGRAVIKGDARVFNQAVVRDHALVAGSAEVFGQAMVHGSAQMSGGEVYGNAEVGGITWIVDETKVYGDAVILSTNIERPIRGDAAIHGTTQLLGDVEHSVDEMTSGIWYGFVHPEFMGDPLWGAERTEPEVEVTMSLQDLTWESDQSDCRYPHVGCAEGFGCVEVNTMWSCVAGLTSPLSYERPHNALIQACIDAL